MNLINFVLRYKWFFMISSFIVALVIGLQFFVPSKSFMQKGKETKSRVFKTKVKLDMKPENIKKIVLDNGMTVLTFKNPSCPKVLLQIAYDIGSAVEEAGGRGLAHLIEHMIFKGTDKLSEGDLDAIARKYGADFNAFTSYDMTSYHFEIDKNNWKPFVPLLADCMQNARFDEQHLASELKTVVQELKMYKDNYSWVMLEKAAELLFPPNHPYHFPIIGYKQDLANLKAQDLKDFYNKYYGPEHATLFIVGDIDLDEAVELARQNFEGIKPKKEQVQPEQPPSIPQSLIQHKSSIYENVQKEQHWFYWLIPGQRDLDDVLLSVVEFILGHGEGSRLYRRLVDEEKIAVDVGSSDFHLRYAGFFLLAVEPVEGKATECRKAIEQELQKIAKEGVSDKELNKVVNTKARQFFQKLQSLSSFTYEWIKSYLTHKDELEVFNKVNKFSNITSEQVQDFVKKYLDIMLMNQIEILPLPEDKKDQWQALKKDSDKMDLEILAKHKRTAAVEEPRFVTELKDPNSLEFSFPKPTKDFTLDNGLKVLFKQNGQWPILNLVCRFKDAEFYMNSKDGILLNLMMSLLIEGSNGYSKDDNVDFFEGLGANYAYDSTGGSFTCLSDNFKHVIDRFFHVLMKPEFSKDAIDKLKNIYIDLYERTKDSPNDVGTKLLKNLVYKGHPYDWTFDQAIEIIKSADSKTLYDLHKKYVTPENVIVSVAGNFDSGKMESALKESLKSWSGGRVKVDYNAKSEFKPNQVLDHFMLRDQVVFLMGKPSIIDIYNPDLVPLRLLNTICFGSMGSRVYQLRERTGLFYAAGGGYAVMAAKEHGFNYVISILSLDSLDEAKKGFLGVIDDFAKNGAKIEELDATRRMYLKDLIDLTASNEGIAAMLAKLEAFELGFDYYDKVLKRVQEMSLDELNKICTKYFTTDDMATVRVGRVGKD